MPAMHPAIRPSGQTISPTMTPTYLTDPARGRRALSPRRPARPPVGGMSHFIIPKFAFWALNLNN